MVFIQWKHSYAETAQTGIVHNKDGDIAVIPKASASVVYTPTTKYLNSWPGESLYVNNTRWRLSGAQVIGGQDGYECLFISNAMNGFYVVTGIWLRDPYTHKGTELNYTPPRDDVKVPVEERRPWSRALRTGYLKPVEIYSACGTTVPDVYLGRKRPSVDARWTSEGGVARPAYTELTRVQIDRLHTPPVSTYVSVFPTITVENYTATYAKFGVYYYQKDGVRTTLARDYPVPINLLYQSTDFTHPDRADNYIVRTSRYVQVNVMTDTSQVPITFAEGVTFAKMDTEAVARVISTRPYRSKIIPVLWDRPLVYLKPDVAALGAGGNAQIQPAVVVPLILCHIPTKDANNNPLAPIDPQTGRRWLRGETLITFVSDSSLLTYYRGNVECTPELYQATRPITTNPVYDEKKTLKDVIEI